MPPSSRELVRSAVGLAVVAPALALLVLAGALMWGGGASGVLSGLFVGAIAVGLLFVALGMTYAPVTIRKILEGGDEDEEPAPVGEQADAGTNGGPPREEQTRSR